MKTTLVKETQEKIILQKKVIMDFFKINDLDYGTFQFELGIKLLNDHLVEQEQIKLMSENKNFWNWFKMQYIECERMVMEIIIETQQRDFIEYQLQIVKAFNARKVHLSFHHFLSVFKFIR